jgi:hypothetical protein
VQTRESEPKERARRESANEHALEGGLPAAVESRAETLRSTEATFMVANIKRREGGGREGKEEPWTLGPRAD